MRKNAVLATGEEDGVELQAFRSVQRHQGDDTSVCFIRIVRNLIRVGDERDALEESTQRGVWFCRPRREICLRIERSCNVDFGIGRGSGVIRQLQLVELVLRHTECCHSANELARDGDQLFEVFQPSLVLRIGRVMQLREIARLVQDACQDGIGGHFGGHHRLMFVEKLCERLQLVHRT